MSVSEHETRKCHLRKTSDPISFHCLWLLKHHLIQNKKDFYNNFMRYKLTEQPCTDWTTPTDTVVLICSKYNNSCFAVKRLFINLHWWYRFSNPTYVVIDSLVKDSINLNTIQVKKINLQFSLISLLRDMSFSNLKFVSIAHGFILRDDFS